MGRFAFLLLLLAANPSTLAADKSDDTETNIANKLAALQRILSHHSESGEYGHDALMEDLDLLLDKNVSSDVLEDLIEDADVSRIEEEPTCPAPEEKPDPKEHVDRHIIGMMSAAQDYDCMEREFDVLAPDYDAREAAYVLNKCRLIVVRNAFPKNYTLSYKKRFAQYLGGLHLDKVSRQGKTTHGEGGFMLKRDSHRWELLLPRNLADRNLYRNPKILNVLKEHIALGPDLSVHGMGAVFSDSGAKAGGWHYDDDYVFGDDVAFETSGVGGHDLPPFCVSMMLAITDVQYDQGPTEFCVGSSYMKGFDPEYFLPVFDKSLVGKGTPLRKYMWHSNRQSCPPNQWRAPLLKTGDAVLFDYQINHRGGQNSSPNLRPMLYVTYSRPWYRDSNFDSSHFVEDTGDPLIARARFSLPERQEECNDPECIHIENIEDFAHDSSEGASFGDKEEPDMSVQGFVVGNRDLESANIYVDGNYVFTLQPNRAKKMEVQVGAVLSLRDNEERVLREWKVISGQGLIVLHSGLFPEH